MGRFVGSVPTTASSLPPFHPTRKSTSIQHICCEQATIESQLLEAPIDFVYQFLVKPLLHHTGKARENATSTGYIVNWNVFHSPRQSLASELQWATHLTLDTSSIFFFALFEDVPVHSKATCWLTSRSMSRPFCGKSFHGFANLHDKVTGNTSHARATTVVPGVELVGEFFVFLPASSFCYTIKQRSQGVNKLLSLVTDTKPMSYRLCPSFVRV